MVDGIIYDKETVVRSAECPHFNRSILGIMAFQILTQNSADGWRKDRGRHSMSSFVKLKEY